MKTTSSTSEVVDMQSMISRRYGVRDVRHGPGSALDFCGRIRWASAQALTSTSGSGRMPDAHAEPTPVLSTLELVGQVAERLPQLGAHARADGRAEVRES